MTAPDRHDRPGAPSAATRRSVDRRRVSGVRDAPRAAGSRSAPARHASCVVPLLTPILFALVIAPALASIGPTMPGIDYMSFVAVGTVGLLVPINCMFAGIGVIVDRENGARRDLLAAPIARPLIVVGNLAVALFVTALQVVVLVGAALLRGADFHLRPRASSGSWSPRRCSRSAMYGVAETLANRIPTQEEYIGVVPADRDRAVVLRRLAVPDHVAARLDRAVARVSR